MTKNSFHAQNLFLLPAVLGLTLLLFTVGCSATASAPGGYPPPLVEVVAVEQKDIPTYREWIGTLDGYVNAPIKAQVNGYLLR
jgi:multidrug efflux pump subunit AcrA (membrane-fusion protein)